MARKTPGDLEARVRVAEVRARVARALAARLRREVARAAAAHMETAARVAGTALLNWCAGDERVRASTVRYLRDHLLSSSDRAALSGTPLDVVGYSDASGSGDVSGP